VMSGLFFGCAKGILLKAPEGEVEEDEMEHLAAATD